jgi:hypothetical protein
MLIFNPLKIANFDKFMTIDVEMLAIAKIVDRGLD